jgi:hypothetical protein
MNYIGITGHRGSGKTSVGYLLGNILDCLKGDITKEEIKNLYPEWCATIKENNNAIYDCCLNNVYFDEFGDMPKAFVASLLSIDMNILNNDTLKDKMFVNMKNFKLYPYNKSFKVLTAKELVEYTKANTPKRWPDIYVSLRNFAAYFSINIMQSIFGTDVWVKTRRQNESLYGEPDFEYTIFSDVKTKEEISYIKEKNGVMVRTLNPSTRKSDAGISNIENTDADFIINTEGNLIDLFEKIYEIGEKIYEMFR